MTKPLLSAICAVFLLLAGGYNADAQLQDLLKRTPPTANVVAVVNVDAVLSSPMAQQGKWRERLGQAGASGMIAAPPAAEWFLMAAEMDYEYMQPIWETAVAILSQRITMQDVAARTGGRLDKLAGNQAVERPNDSYVVAFSPRIVGARFPANRQNVIRWVRESKARKQPGISPYLSAAVADATDGGNEIVLAFELSGLLAPAEVSAALAKSPALAEAKIDPKQAGNVLATILGMRLAVNIDTAPHAVLSISFQADPSLLAPAAKSLLTEILVKRGARIEELPRWTSRVEGNSILLAGDLSASGLRRVLSFLSSPVGPWSMAAGGASTTSGGATSATDERAKATRYYFQTIIGYLDDLFGKQGVQPGNLGQVSIWVERYARNIADLNVEGVDPDAVKFADQVTADLQEIGTTIQYAAQRSNTRQANYDNYGRSRYGQYGTYGYFQKGDVTRDLNLIQADEAIKGARSSQAIVEEIRTLSFETKKLLTERYGGKF